MVLFLYSKLNPEEKHIVSLFEDISKRVGLKTYSLDMHSLFDAENSLRMESGSIHLNGINLSEINSVVCLSIPRIDSLLRHKKSKYPGRSRMQAQSFIDDLGFLLADKKWIPGNFQSILAGNSKMTLFKIASKNGLSVPASTLYGQLEHLSISGKWYLKALGYPCVVSLNAEKGQEVFIRSENKLHDVDEVPVVTGLHQWQTYIPAASQIRTHVVSGRVRAKLWVKPPDLKAKDIRDILTTEPASIKWQDYVLPEDVSYCLKETMREMNISVAAPEFFITESGEHVFYDLNPCGDFTGFFKEDSEQIIKEMIDLAV